MQMEHLLKMGWLPIQQRQSIELSIEQNKICTAYNTNAVINNLFNRLSYWNTIKILVEIDSYLRSS